MGELLWQNLLYQVMIQLFFLNILQGKKNMSSLSQNVTILQIDYATPKQVNKKTAMGFDG